MRARTGCVVVVIGAALYASGSYMAYMTAVSRVRLTSPAPELRTIHTVQGLFREGDKDRDNTPNYAADLQALAAAKLIPEHLAEGKWRQGSGIWATLLPSGYRIEVYVPPGKTRDDAWAAEAVPIDRERSGDRYFFVDQTGLVRFSTTGPATAQSAPFGS